MNTTAQVETTRTCAFADPKGLLNAFTTKTDRHDKAIFLENTVGGSHSFGGNYSYGRVQPRSMRPKR